MDSVCIEITGLAVLLACVSAEVGAGGMGCGRLASWAVDSAPIEIIGLAVLPACTPAEVGVGGVGCGR